MIPDMGLIMSIFVGFYLIKQILTDKNRALRMIAIVSLAGVILLASDLVYNSFTVTKKTAAAKAEYDKMIGQLNDMYK